MKLNCPCQHIGKSNNKSIYYHLKSVKMLLIFFNQGLITLYFLFNNFLEYSTILGKVQFLFICFLFLSLFFKKLYDIFIEFPLNFKVCSRTYLLHFFILILLTQKNSILNSCQILSAKSLLCKKQSFTAKSQK